MANAFYLAFTPPTKIEELDPGYYPEDEETGELLPDYKLISWLVIAQFILLIIQFLTKNNEK